jgi:pyruvate/2-oxoglutarate dehydrogenase complex dihydrolipoamide dehydrogenase (E3) component
MSVVLTPDLAVIGAGSGGLAVAAGAAQLGVPVVLVERDRMGGDCLNVGCVPSKSLIAAAHAARTVRTAGRMGVNGHEPAVDFAAVHRHVHGVIAAIAPHDSVERFEGLGVTVLKASARFTGPGEIVAGDTTVRARRFVVATGSRPAVPPIPGLDTVPLLTNETIFELTDRPEHLVVIGAGAIGVELAQAHRRLGARVTVLEQATLLPKDDPEAVAVVRARLVEEGVELHEGAGIRRVERDGNGIAVVLADAAGETRIAGSHLLVAAGRRPNVEDLGLDAAGIAHGPRGITVDAGLKTSNPKVFAIGDVTGGPQLTHMAGHHASVVVKAALFRLPARVEARAVPWVTYADPELAQVGLTEALAREQGVAVTVARWAFRENDRAQAERETEGFVKILVDKGGRPVGATLVGPRAGEQAALWALAIQERVRLARIAQLVVPYPTLAEVSKRAAGSWFAPKLFSDRTRWLVRQLRRLG